MELTPTAKQIQAYLFTCLISINQYKKARIINTQPPEANVKELVLMRFIIGVMLVISNPKPSIKPTTPAITR